MLVSRAPSLYSLLRDSMSLIRPLLCCASLCVLARPAVAQSVASAATSNYRISRIVTAFGGNPVDQAEITLLRDGAIRQSAFSGVDGRFILGELSAGKAGVPAPRLCFVPRKKKKKARAGAKTTPPENRP